MICTQRSICGLIACCCVPILMLYIWTSGDDLLQPLHSLSKPKKFSGSGASNDTLGFGAIYILTENPFTWRVQGLLKAADLVGIKVQVPVQRHVPDHEVREHVGGEPPDGYDSTRALLNHLALLEEFAQSEVETALIMEDDVDFGTAIRAQMALLSHTFWARGGQPSTPTEEALHPYRDSDWDILWPGHGGIAFANGMELVKYNDSYALPWNRLTSKFNNYYDQMASGTDILLREPQQLIFSCAPMATFAYAITRTHATQLVRKLRKDGGGAFDTAMHIDCMGNRQRCVAPVPELFHHHQVLGENSLTGRLYQENGTHDMAMHDMAWYQTQHKYTFNVEWSARCNSANVGEKLGDRWQCLPNRYDQIV